MNHESRITNSPLYVLIVSNTDLIVSWPDLIVSKTHLIVSMFITEWLIESAVALTRICTARIIVSIGLVIVISWELISRHYTMGCASDKTR